MRVEKGTLFRGRYRLGDCLGVGGAANVYRVHDTYLGVDRALKLINAQLGPRKESVRSRLQNEAKAMVRLDHPHVLRVHDLGFGEEGDYIVMELVEGGSLDQRLLTRGPLAPARVIQLTTQLLSALEVTHKAGIIHRDIKPQNILLRTPDHALLADFGIALMANDPSARRTRADAALGSMVFMAPEQRLDARNVTAQADLYALACTAINLLTGRNPMDIFMVGKDSSRWLEVPPYLRPLLHKATRLEPSERHQSAQAMAAELLAVRTDMISQSLLNSGPTSPGLPEPAARTHTQGGGHHRVRKKRVLVVEDAADVALMMRLAVQRLLPDVELVTVGSAERALEELRENGPYTVMVSDINLPGLSGGDLVRLIESGYDSPPRVVIVSGMKPQAIAEVARRPLVAACFRKPVPPKKIAQAIREAINTSWPD